MNHILLTAAITEGHGVKIEALDFFLDMTIGSGMFWAVLCCCFVLAPLLWTKGYALTEWLYRRKLAEKCGILVGVLAVFLAVGCMSQDVNEQSYGGWFALPVAVTLISAAVLAISIKREASSDNKDGLPLDSNQRWQRHLMLLAKTMVFIWSFGWALAFFCHAIVHQPHVGAELLIHSAVTSLELFMMEYDGHLLLALASYDILKGLIVCTGFVATLCTMVLLLGLVVSRIAAHLHLRHLKIDAQHNHLYIFFGINDASKLLGDDILKNDEAATVIYVENSLAAEEKAGADDGETRVKSLFLIKRDKFKAVENNRRKALAIANSSVYSLEVGNNDVWNMIGLQTVGKMLLAEGSFGRLGKDARLHVLFMSGEIDKDMMSAAILTKDITLNAAQYKTTIYSNGHRNDINCVLEVESLERSNGRLSVRVLDASSLALEHLKSNVENHPVNFVDVQTTDKECPGTVTSAFTSLIIGFGEMGQGVARFLYEYGAFVADGSTMSRSRRSEFHCHVVDKNMNKLKGGFIASLPGASLNGEQEGVDFNFHNMDLQASEFYDEVLTDDFIEKLNYVVVSLGNDEQNMSVALSLLRRVFQKRTNSRHFRIYVHIRNKESHMEPVAQYYNKWMACTGDHTILQVFGYNKAIYTFDNIVSDRYSRCAQIYYEGYAAIADGEDHQSWNQRRKSIIDKGAPIWARLQEIYLKEVQDRSNAVHALTKLKIIELAGDKAADYEDLNAQLKEVLAMTEHLRWNASNELMGYVYGEEKDYKRKTHPCIVPWEKLPEDTQRYDYIVTKTSMELKGKL